MREEFNLCIDIYIHTSLHLIFTFVFLFTYTNLSDLRSYTN